MMLLFGLVPYLMAKFETDQPFTLYIVDDLGIYETNTFPSSGKVQYVLSSDSREALVEKTRGHKNQSFVILDRNTLQSGIITIYSDNDAQGAFAPASQVLQSALYHYKLVQLGLTPDGY